MTAVKSWLYFAYGFNINLTRMRQKCPKAKVAGIGRVDGYRLAFYEHSVVWDSAMETIVPDPESAVWGVVYELNEFEWEDLDGYEDARMDGTGAYFHYPVEVVVDGQAVSKANVYLKARWGEGGLPSDEYLAVMISGAREQGLPEDYIRQLEQQASRPAAYPVPKRPGGGGKYLFSGDCSGCDAG